MKTHITEQKISKKENIRKWIVRAFALLLAIFMVGGTFYYIIVSLAELLA